MKKTTKTISAKDVSQQWWLFDASNQVLGRFASEVAQVLRGKHRPDYSPNIYMGDAVIIVNADKIRVTGNKSETKKYFRHSGYPGGVKYASFSELMKNDSDKVVLNAVKGMLPKNKLGANLFRNLHVFTDSNHKFEAQKPSTIDLNKVN